METMITIDIPIWVLCVFAPYLVLSVINSALEVYKKYLDYKLNKLKQ